MAPFSPETTARIIDVMMMAVPALLCLFAVLIFLAYRGRK